MKYHIILSIVFFYFTLVGFSQKTVQANQILNNIKEEKAISYKNTTVQGVLDFTFIKEAIQHLPSKKKWINNSNEVNKLIKSSITFINCTFTGDVLAYIPDKETGYTFTASFEDNVIFKNCVFEKKALFKYSEFKKECDFSESKFKDDSSFKYSKFKNNTHFENTYFENLTTFKYAVFNTFISFENSIFNDSATFKYTQFKNGVSFKNTNFKEDLDIKYTKVWGNFNISNMKVGYDIDSKYTKINGHSFSKYLINTPQN
ncbi:pentapeptide repeat-containing protein [Tenacibaculum sp. UWU-22]|uniref:pentapeptide repeat-containing protein n=1 Tax=Tenacibaculum sp. UWU-22 TaxID=3234187 RepID=UPI0034DB4391